MMRGEVKKEKNWGPRMAKQEPAADADINNMVNRFFKTGYMPQTGKQPRFGDFTGPGFHEMHNAVAAAKAQFLGLEPKLRRRFGNSVGNLVEWVNDPSNEAEAIKLGLLSPKVPEPLKEAPLTGKELDDLLQKNDKLLQAMRADDEANPRKKPKPPEGD